MNWVDEFLQALQKLADNDFKIKWTDESGQEMLVEIKQDLISLFLENRHRLGRIGKDTFKQVLLLFSKKQDFDALFLVYNELDTQDLIDKYKENAQKMAEIAIQIQEDRKFWISLGKQVGVKIVFAALTALL